MRLTGERGKYQLAHDLPAIQVPGTVQAILTARIDRLPAGEKRLLEIAAVIGRDFPLTLLQAVADESEETLRRGLAHLQAAEFVYEATLFPDLAYSFKHALTHEMAYGSLLAGSAARPPRSDRGDHGTPLPRSSRGARSSGSPITRSAPRHGRWRCPYLRRAGLKAAERSALQEARVCFEQALAVLDRLPESSSTLEQGFDVRLELRRVLNLLGSVRQVLERLREAEVLAERLDDDRRRGRVRLFMVNVLALLGELDEALVAGARALEIAVRSGDLRIQIWATTYLAQTHFYRGDFARAVELATDNLAALPADWVDEPGSISMPIPAYNRLWLVYSLAELGRFAEATHYAADVLRLAEPTQRPFTIAEAYFCASWIDLHKGDWAKANSLVERGIAVVRAGNVVLNLPGRHRFVRLDLGPARRVRRGADPTPRGRAAPRTFAGAWRRRSHVAGTERLSCSAGSTRRGV